MKIKTLIPFTVKDGDDFISPRKGEILDVSDEEGAQLIASGVAEVYTVDIPMASVTVNWPENYSARLYVPNVVHADVDGLSPYFEPEEGSNTITVPLYGFGTIMIYESMNKYTITTSGNVSADAYDGISVIMGDGTLTFELAES